MRIFEAEHLRGLVIGEKLAIPAPVGHGAQRGLGRFIAHGVFEALSH